MEEVGAASGLPFSILRKRRAVHYLPGGAVQYWALHCLSGGAPAGSL